MDRFLQVLMEMDRRILIGIGIVAGVVMIFLLWGFWLDFIGLTLLYLAIGAGIIYAIARFHHGRDPWEYLNEVDVWFWGLGGMFAVTFVIAWFNYGPALLLPENLPTPKQRGFLTNVVMHLLWGNNAPAKTIPTEPLPWATGTWFWWKAWPIYFVAFLIAVWEELMHGIRAAEVVIERHRASFERRRAAATPPSGGEAGGPAVGTAPLRANIWEMFSWGLVIEVLGEFFTHFLEHRFGRRTVA